jgi:K+-sensing histidine kinase KdpD
LADYLSTPIEGLETALQAGWQFLANVPLQFEDKVRGLLTIFINTSGANASEKANTPHAAGKLALRQFQLLRAIGQQAGVAIENERLTKQAAETKVAQEVDYLRSELIANISHELRTPLGLIKATSTTLLAKDVKFDRQTEQMLLEGLDEETDKLESLVDNLLDLSSLDRKGLLLHCIPTDISQLVKKIIEPMQAQHTMHHFAHQFPHKPLIADIDADRIEQVLRNLLTNAVKYSPNGGTITIKGRDENHQIIISVIDQGIGISSKDLKRIFERFYRAKNNTTFSIRGAGLGLAISREIIDAHNGHIWAENNTPGNGSTFHISLPAN